MTFPILNMSKQRYKPNFEFFLDILLLVNLMSKIERKFDLNVHISYC